MAELSAYHQTSHDLFHRCTASSVVERNRAFEELRQRLVRAARRQAHGVEYLEHIVEDCANEALFVITRKLNPQSPADSVGGPEEPEHFLGWSMTIVLREVEEARRRLDSPAANPKRVPARFMMSLDAPSGADDERPPPEPLASGRHNEPEFQVAYIASVTHLAVQALNRVSERSRAVLFREGHDGLCDEEIAADLSISPKQVHQTRWHNRRTLQTEHSDLVAQFRELCAWQDGL